MRNRVTFQGELTPDQTEVLARLAAEWGATLDVVSDAKPPSLYAELRCAGEAAADFREARDLDTSEACGGSWYGRVGWFIINRRLKVTGYADMSFESALGHVARRDSNDQTAANWIENAGPERLRSPPMVSGAMIGTHADLRSRAKATRRRIYDAFRDGSVAVNGR